MTNRRTFLTVLLSALASVPFARGPKPTRARIVKIGTVDMTGPVVALSDWRFDFAGCDCFGVESSHGKILVAGYTIEELQAIAA